MNQRNSVMMTKPTYFFDKEKGCGVIVYCDKTYYMDVDDRDKIINFSKNFAFQNDADLYPSFHYNAQTVNYLTFLYGFKDKGGNVTYTFRNNNPLDLRRDNVVIYHEYHETVVKTHNVVQYFPGHYSKNGSDPYQMKNPLWKVTDKDAKETLLMYCEPGILCNLCTESFTKILEYESKVGSKLSWFGGYNGYIAARCSTENKQYYIHQIITGCFGNGRGTKTVSVDHIDRNPHNNRWDNLRIATREEQEQNSKGIAPGTKRARKTSAKPLPEGITKEMFRKYVVYYHEYLNEEKTRSREFFKIEKHPRLDKVYIGTKSNKVPLLEKLNQINKIVDELEAVYPVEPKSNDDT